MKNKNSDFSKEIVTTKKERKSLKVKKDSTDFYSFMIIAFIESDCLHKIGSYIGFSFSAKRGVRKKGWLSKIDSIHIS